MPHLCTDSRDAAKPFCLHQEGYSLYANAQILIFMCYISHYNLRVYYVFESGSWADLSSSPSFSL